MLEFWFNPKISIAQKILFLLVIGILAAVLYWMKPLAADAILMFLGTGIIFLICRYSKIHFFQNDPTKLLYRLLTWIPIALLLTLIFMKAQEEILMLGVQGTCFMALGICLFSPMSLFNQNKLNVKQDR